MTTLKVLLDKGLSYFFVPHSGEYRYIVFYEPAKTGRIWVPDLGRRQFMNRLTFGMITGMAAGALYSVVKYVIAPTSGGVTAKDALGNDVRVS